MQVEMKPKQKQFSVNRGLSKSKFLSLSPRPKCKVHRVASWDQYLRLVTNPPYSTWVFRGQGDAKWPLSSSLSRYLLSARIPTERWQEQERRVLRIFKRKAHLLLTHVPADDDDFQWLALMQHHGAPTRLLDFTWSPYVAAFFALERATSDAAVWGINPYAESWGAGLRTPAGDQVSWRDVDLRTLGVFEKHYIAGVLSFVWVGNPFLMNRRLIAQSGTFAVPGAITRPLEQIAPKGHDLREALIKFVLPSESLRKTAMWELFRMNITNATLFPDLDGLARSMGYELEYWNQSEQKTPRNAA
jgi:hypothetical protein